MTSLQKINSLRPSYFVGNRTLVSDDQELIVLAQTHGNDRLRLVSSAVTDEITLSVGETQLLLTCIAGGEWRVLFERNLQSLSAKADGDLLTTWIAMEEFDCFIVSNKHDGPLPLRSLFHRLADATQNWKNRGVEEVYYEGYEL